MEEKSIENENEYLFQWQVIPIFYFEIVFKFKWQIV